MRVLFFTSGSGSTAEYITRQLKKTPLNGVELVGFVYEPNEEIENRFNKLVAQHQVSNHNFFKVNRQEFTNNEEFHSRIWDTISRYSGEKRENRIDLIMLLGWMHIIPKSFITRCNETHLEIVNLHPTLQYQLIGRDIYPKIWNMYQDGMIRETGCIVHRVSEHLDRGAVIHECKLDLSKYSYFEEYKMAMYGRQWKSDCGNEDGDGREIIGLEKECVWQALTKLNEAFWNKMMTEIDITPSSMANGDVRASGLVLKHRGKVRDIYESADYPKYLFVQTSDRISANDIVIAYLPGKGVLLNQINTFWHRMFGIRQMVLGTDSSMMVIRKMRAIPLEIIIRRRLTGSLWKAYSQKGQRVVNGYELKEGMTDGDLFDEPIITPTTKGTHDIPISFDEIITRGILNKKEIEEIKSKATSLFLKGDKYMRKIGIEMIDTKFEFAFAEDGSLEVIDEVFTPDSSRFIVDGKRMDKDILRKWATENEVGILEHSPREDGCRAVELPTEVNSRLLANYSQFLSKLLETQNKDIMMCYGTALQMENNLANSLERLERIVIIIAGSKSDAGHVEKIRMELAKQDILAWVYYASAHKNTQAVMRILNKYESMASRGNGCKIIYITVAGMSNALSGVVAANTTNPVLACPPLGDKNDYQINIHSTLQMPSGVPSACILRPDNLASFCKRILTI
jgi:phosphoribosylaminoimidazole-succinocarboxamide synthase